MNGSSSNNNNDSAKKVLLLLQISFRSSATYTLENFVKLPANFHRVISNSVDENMFAAFPWRITI
jgi:hypothetical protein